MKPAMLFCTILLCIACTVLGDDTVTGNLLDSEQLSAVTQTDHTATINEGQRIFKEKCLKNADLAAFEATKRAKDELRSCIQSLVNVTVMQQEIERAKPTGDLDVVFGKYCRKSPQLLNCVGNFTTTAERCLDATERASSQIVQNITAALVKFICFKDGDRIALFIAEGGPECLDSHQEDIKQCINQTMSSHFSGGLPSVNSLPSLVLGAKECKNLRTVQTCVVRKLESCAEPTPANIVDALFNFVFKMTPCKSKPASG